MPAHTEPDRLIYRLYLDPLLVAECLRAYNTACTSIPGRDSLAVAVETAVRHWIDGLYARGEVDPHRTLSDAEINTSLRRRQERYRRRLAMDCQPTLTITEDDDDDELYPDDACSAEA